jgi:hypothetical protein
MEMRHFPEKTQSQIVFDITGGDKGFSTMTMATIPKQRVFARHNTENFSLRTDDIEGARWQSNPIKTRHHTLQVGDIDGARPSTAYDPSRPPTDVMAVRDIDNAQPRIYRHLPHSRRHTNPLCPEYELSKKEEPPPPVVPFIYDGINFDDIPGVHPRSYKSDRPPRDPLKTSDIPGTRPRPLVRNLDRPPRDVMKVTDINDGGEFRSSRHTNPLNPEDPYAGAVLTADYGRPVTNYLSRQDGLDASLKTSDIDGALATRPRPPRRKEKVAEDDINQPAPTLMLPSMYRQTAELERQRAVNKMRSDRIYRFEHRHLQHRDPGDRAQSGIRKQRAASVQRSRLGTDLDKIVL